MKRFVYLLLAVSLFLAGWFTSNFLSSSAGAAQITNTPEKKSSAKMMGTFAFRVNEVMLDGPAEKVGLQYGDLIQRVNGMQFTSVEQFTQFTQSEPGTTVVFDVIRQEQDGQHAYTLSLKTVAP